MRDKNPFPHKQQNKISGCPKVWNTSFWKSAKSTILLQSQCSSVGVLSDYKLDDWGLIPSTGKDFSSSICVQTSSEAHPVSYK
jgi:hypothetical protein